jgi:CelD/BcsL family acetyltransferase involved in cellulose biosynthesis
MATGKVDFGLAATDREETQRRVSPLPRPGRKDPDSPCQVEPGEPMRDDNGPTTTVVMWGGTAMLSFESVESVSDLKSLEADWISLQGRAPHTPFQDWAWHHCWWKNVGESLHQKPFMMTAWDRSTLKLVVPFCISKDGDVLQWSAGEVSDYCDVLAEKHDSGLVPKAVSRAFSKFPGTRLRMKQTRHDSLAYREVTKIRNVTSRDDYICPILYLDRSGKDTPQAGIDRRVLADANRQRRRLGEIGPVTLKEFTDADAIRSCAGKIIADKKDWLARRGLKNILCTDPGESFLAEALPHLSSRGSVHASALQLDGQPLSSYISLVHGKRYYYYFGSWDYAWGNYSPGKLHLMDLISYAAGNGFTEFDMLRGDEEYKKKISTDFVVIHSIETEKKRSRVLVQKVARKLKSLLGLPR